MSTDTVTGFNELRNLALHRAEELGEPDVKLEAWRYVGTDALNETRTATEAPRVLPVGRSSEPGLVFANGCYDLGAAADLPGSIDVDIMAGDTTGAHPLLETLRARLSETQDVSECWSIADMRSAVHLRINESIENPLLLLDIATDTESGWHGLIELAAGVRASVLILRLTAPGARASSGIDVRLAPGASLNIDEIGGSTIEEEVPGQIFSHKRIQCAEESQLRWVTIDRGGSLIRHNWQVDLLGEKAHAFCAGAALTKHSEQCHHYLRMRHAIGNTSSEQLFKFVADDQSRCSFDGLVHMDAHASDAAAEQLCKGLQLNNAARICARPQLDIHVDDVTASHGAAIGKLDAEQLAYLRSRGLSADDAEATLMAAFLDQIVNELSIPQGTALARSRLAITSGE